MTPKHNDRPVHQPRQGIARVRQGDAVADARAMELFALLQRPQQRLSRRRLFRKLGDLIDQLAQHPIPVSACQPQRYGRRRKQAAQEHRVCVLHGAYPKDRREGVKKKC